MGMERVGVGWFGLPRGNTIVREYTSGNFDALAVRVVPPLYNNPVEIRHVAALVGSGVTTTNFVGLMRDPADGVKFTMMF